MPTTFHKAATPAQSGATRATKAICASTVHLPIAETEDLILSTVERDLLDASVFADAIAVAVKRLSREAPEVSALGVERQRLDWELSNLVSAVAAGGDSPSLVVEIRRREARRAELDRQLSRTVLDEGDLRKALERRLQDWKGLLRSQPVHGQTVLRILLDGPIVIGAEQADGVSWEAQANLEGLLGTLSHQVASPAGLAPKRSNPFHMAGSVLRAA